MNRSRYRWLLVLVDLCLISGQVIINTEPNELVDRESGSVTCFYNNAYSISLLRSVQNSVIASCIVSIPAASCIISAPGPENNYINYTGFYTASKTTTSVTINIDTVSKQRDDGIWRCRILGLQSESFANNITIDVKVPVKGVEIENKELNVTDGISTTMNCKITNNPDPVLINYRWFIVETDQTLSTSSTSSTSSSFQLTPNKTQNGQTLSCSADNGYGSSKSDTVILNVQYKPSVKIEPEVSGNYSIIEGNTVELKCIVTDANPNDAGSLSYKWNKDTTTTTSTFQVSQKGTYTCSVSNGIGTGISDSITIDVLFPPRVTLTSQYSIIESNNLTISCTATSNPLPISYTWSGPNNLIQSQQTLTIPSINRDQTGRYTCKVVNTMIPNNGGQQNGTGTNNTDVTVLYGPEVGVSTSRKDIIESDKLVINCSVIQSKPDDASINWYKPDGTSISSNILSINNTRRDQGGIYSCNSSKVLQPTVGSTKTNVDSKTTFVNVWYLDPVKITRDELVIQEGDTINITCTTQSNPTASINYRNGTDVIQTVTSNQASFIKLGATCLDTSFYSCQVSNPNISQTSYNDTTQILVHCSPRPDPRVDHQYKITGDIGESVNLTARVISYPKPIFQWYYRENNVDIPIVNNGSFQQTDRSTNINTFISTLTINITTNTAKRRYYLNVSNEVNPSGTDLQYAILSETVPDRPINVTYKHETADTICVEWTPGFNGGASQSFIVQHSTDDKAWVNSSKIPDDTNNGRVDYCIEGLEPDTSYYIRVIASNKYGESPIGTLSQSEPPKTAQRHAGDGTDAALIGGVVGAALALIIIVIFVVFIIRRKKSKRPDKHEENSSQLILNETPTSNQMIIDVNPAYVSVDDLQNDKETVKNETDTTTVEPKYAAVKKPNQSKQGTIATQVYSSVKKEKKKETNKKEDKKKPKTKQQMKGIGIVTENQDAKTRRPGEVYENVGIFGNMVYENNPNETSEEQTKTEGDDLVYVDLKFDKEPSSKVNKKSADEDQVEYGSIDYGKRGPTPPPASDSSEDEMDYLPPKKDEIP